MTEISRAVTDCLSQQSAQTRCMGPTNPFIDFKKEELEQSIPSRFEQQVAKYPDRVAVKTKNGALTYEALNQTANRIARAILAQRGRGEETIALLLEHDAPMIAAMLGALKAGKIYVPLDPSLPRARTTYILEDAQASLIVTNNKNVSLVKDLVCSRLQLLNIDELDCGLSPENLRLSISPDTFAWIIYTSGSTGQPKGVVQNHRNVLHWIMKYTNAFHICADDRLTLLFSCSFGAAVLDIFAALLNSAALYPFNLKKEGLAHLAYWLIQEGITFYHSVPTVFRNFLHTLAGEEKFPNLRLINLDGEPVSRKEVELYREHFHSNCIFVNSLGSAETGSIRRYFIDKQTEIFGNIVPVGYAAEDMELLLINDDGEEIGFNCIGEIAVKSRYLTPGYWRRPDLTKAAFLPDPEGGDERIYRTGDVGRMLADGCLLHLGRKDFQVKIRGYRVEVGEVESALLALDNVKDAAVVAREDQGEEKRLVAYIVPIIKTPIPTVMVLRRALREKLPDYMIPSAFVVLDAMPLTPNGKVDRGALPDPGKSRPELDTPFVAPRTPVEEKLAQIWAEVLSLDEVGIHDNFLELGGHSLLATQIISRVIDRFRVELPVKSLLEAPTVAEMAVVITQNQAKKVGPEEMARMLSEVEGLSDEEAQHLLADKSS